MAQAGKENLQGARCLPRNLAEPGQKESTLSSSKIPVLSKSRLLPELKQSQLQSRPRLACPSSVKSKGIKVPKMTLTGSVPGAVTWEPATGLLPKSCTREPLGEMQLSMSGQKNVVEDGVSNAKGAGANEFVPDTVALASILSNTGLTSHVGGASHKVSLAGRVPLRGNRGCSTSTGVGRGSLHTGTPTVNPVRMSHISRLMSKVTETGFPCWLPTTGSDTDHQRSSSLALNTQQVKALSATLKSLGPGVTAKPNPSTEDLDAGKCEGSGARPKAGCQSSVSEADIAIQSNSCGRKETTASSWKDQEFVPDPAARATILSNIGLSHSAFAANGKPSLAQRVSVKDTRKPPAAGGSTRANNAALLGPCMSAPPTAKFGRVSCRTTQGTKGLEASEALLANTPGKRCSVLDYSPYGLARRVPVACPQSLRPSRWRGNHVPLPSCTKDKRAGASYLTKTPQVLWPGELQTEIVGFKQDGTAVPWEKIAVRLFDDRGASAKKAPAASVVTQDMGKLQRIEHLVQLLRQEINSNADCEVAPSLEELHKLLSAHCSPALEASKPSPSATPLPEPKPSHCEQVPMSSVAVAPEPSTGLSASTQQPVCPRPGVHSLQSPSSSSTSNTGEPVVVFAPIGQVKQRLDDLLRAPNRFHEACLNDECAFYAARVSSVAQPSVPRCKEPVAKMLDAHDAMHFVSIATLLEAPSPSPS